MIDRLVARTEVEERFGLSCTTIYRLMRAGKFPEPIKVGGKAVRWRESELDAWVASRPRASGEGASVAA